MVGSKTVSCKHTWTFIHLFIWYLFPHSYDTLSNKLTLCLLWPRRASLVDFIHKTAIISYYKRKGGQREREREGWNVKHAYLIIDMQGKCDGDTWAMHKWLLGLTVLDLKIFLCQFRTPDSAKVLHAWILWLLWESKNLSWCRLLIRLSQANVVEGVKMENQIN